LVAAFENVIEGFQDALVASKNVNVYGTDGQLMERARDTIWRPQQYISVGQDRIVGSAVSAKGKEQLSVPATLGFQPNDTFELDALELRDQLRDGQLGMASKDYLASRINGTFSRLPAFRARLWSRSLPLRANTITSRCATASATSRASQPTTVS
jgi:hypothetical protein